MVGNGEAGSAWVFDSPIGHLSMAERGGWLQEILGIQAVRFDSVQEALDQLTRTGPPQAILVGYLRTEEGEKLVSDARLRSVPMLVLHGEVNTWASGSKREVIDVVKRLDTISAVKKFALRRVGRSVPRSAKS